MSYATVSLDNTPYSEQYFSVTLDGGARNVEILLKLRYLDQYKYWLADIFDKKTGAALVCNVPFVRGTDILKPYSWLNIGEAYIAPITDTNLEQPDNATLGSVFVLMWGDDS